MTCHVTCNVTHGPPLKGGVAIVDRKDRDMSRGSRHTYLIRQDSADTCRLWSYKHRVTNRQILASPAGYFHGVDTLHVKALARSFDRDFSATVAMFAARWRFLHALMRVCHAMPWGTPEFIFTKIVGSHWWACCV